VEALTLSSAVVSLVGLIVTYRVVDVDVDVEAVSNQSINHVRLMKNFGILQTNIVV